MVVVDDSVRQLPHFDPDLEVAPPDVVQRFRAACESADGVMLAVPEYTFGLPGAFKNALDWTVGSGSLYRKPIAVLHVAPGERGEHAREALGHVLRAHNADVTHHQVPILHRDREVNGEITDPRIAEELRAVVAELARRASASTLDEYPLNAIAATDSGAAQVSLRRRPHN